MLRTSALRGGLREGAARPDPDDAIIGFNQVAGTRQQERRLAIEHDQHGFEPAQRAIGAPVLGELDRRALEVAAILLELGFEAREQRKRIGRRPGKAGEDAVVVEAADLPAPCLTTVLPSVTWPSPASTARSSRRTARMVVAWNVESISASVSHPCPPPGGEGTNPGSGNGTTLPRYFFALGSPRVQSIRRYRRRIAGAADRRTRPRPGAGGRGPRAGSCRTLHLGRLQELPASRPDSRNARYGATR